MDDHPVPLGLPSKVLWALTDHIGESYFGPKQPVASPVIDTSRGYQWKQLFLPNGTELLTIYCGRSLYATVENEQNISDGLPTTPSRLANAQGCGTRNAWKTIWLYFPGAKRWELAARCRDAER